MEEKMVNLLNKLYGKSEKKSLTLEEIIAIYKDISLEENPPPPAWTLRKNTRKMSEVKEDFEAAFLAAYQALGKPTLPISPTLEELIEEITPENGYIDTCNFIGRNFPPAFFGYMLLFSIEAESSLMNYALTHTRSRDLEQLDLKFEELQWPRSVLHPEYIDDGIDDEQPYNILKAYVEAWKETYK